MRKVTLFLMCAIGMALASCTSKMYTTRSTPILRESIPTNPIIANLDVDLSKKVKGEAVVKGPSATPENAKQMALWNAMEESGADLIVDPIFELTIKFKKITAKVIGYKGVYKNVHTATEKEIENLLMYREAQPMMLQKDGTAGKGKGFLRLFGR